MALRAAQEVRAGMSVNLGIGLPTLVASQLPANHGALLQAENGILGYGRILDGDGPFDRDMINGGGEPVELVAGASFFNSADSFAMIRGGHLDLAILGGLQVAQTGDLANWMLPARGGGSIGGAMGLAVGARRLLVVMEHRARDGASRLVTECTYPLTAQRCVDRIITDLAVIDVVEGRFVLMEVAPGVGPDEVQAATDAPLAIAETLREMSFA
jgi:3-oxoacid CoA-transferase subunit B